MSFTDFRKEMRLNKQAMLQKHLNENSLDDLEANSETVCFCLDKSKCKHQGISNLLELIDMQFQSVSQINDKVDSECEFLSNSVKKLVYIRGHSYYEQVSRLVQQKDSEIKDLRTEIAKLIVLKKENEVL